MIQWTVRSHHFGRSKIRLKKPLMTSCRAQLFLQVAQAESGSRFPPLLLHPASGGPITGAAEQLGCPHLPAAFPAALQTENGAGFFWNNAPLSSYLTSLLVTMSNTPACNCSCSPYNLPTGTQAV